jgi:hypothetical protein
MKNTLNKVPSKWHGLTPATAAATAVGLGIAAAKGLGMETELPDGSSVVDTLPTYAAAVAALLTAIGTGSGLLNRALLAPPTDDKGNTNSALTISVAIGQAFREKNGELVKKLQETCNLTKETNTPKEE